MYYSYGMSICYRYVSDKEEAQYIFNNAFLKIFENMHKYNTTRDFKPWFKTIMANTAINHIKKMNKFKVEGSNEAIENIATKEDILSKISFDELVATIQSLSISYRTVFNMYVLDGFKHEEISKKLGISVGTSKSNLSRAKLKLRQIIQHKILTHG